MSVAGYSAHLHTIGTILGAFHLSLVGPHILEVQLSGPLYPKLSTCFEGARLTQLVQLVTAGRLFPYHEGRVNP